MSRSAAVALLPRTDDVVRARISRKTKEAAIAVLDEYGLNTSDLIRLTMTMIAREKTLPEGLLAKREKTTRAIREGRRDVAKLKGYANAKSMLSDLE